MITVFSLSICLTPLKTDSAEKLLNMESTAYCTGTTCYDGSPVRKGIASASKQMLGMDVAIYSDDLSEFYGWYEIKDTGSNEKNSSRKVRRHLSTNRNRV